MLNLLGRTWRPSPAFPHESMSGSVVYKIRPPVKRVEFKAKSTTRGTRFKQFTVKSKPSPPRGCGPPISKRFRPTEVEPVEQRESDEPLLQSKGKVSSKLSMMQHGG
jgi:hypothetical protein